MFKAHAQVIAFTLFYLSASFALGAPTFTGVSIKIKPPNRKAALEAVVRTEKLLGEYRHGSGAVVAKTMLEFIQAARAEGVLDLPVTVGTSESAEFGSTSSGFRLTGAKAVTPTALSTSILRWEDSQNTAVMLHVISSHPIISFGYEGNEIQVSFLNLKDKGKIILKVKGDFYQDEVQGDVINRHHLQLTAEINTNSPAVQSWREINFKVEPANIISWRKNDGSASFSLPSCAVALKELGKPNP